MSRTVEAETLEDAVPHEFLVLVPVPKAICTKQIHRDGTIGHKVSKNFRFEPKRFKNPNEFFKQMEKLQDAPYCFVVRGHPNKAVDMSCDVRRIVRKTGEGTILPATRAWVTLDIDGIPAGPKAKILANSFDPRDPETTIKDVIELLPRVFHDVSCHWRYSSSTGFKGDTVSCHLTFILDTPTSDDNLKRYFQTFNEGFITIYGQRLVDPALFNPIQPHYTAAPIIDIEDPLSQRSGTLRYKTDVVPFAQEWVVEVEGGDEERRYMKFFDRVGDNYDGFHHPIMQGIASWINYHGTPEGPARKELKRLVRSYVDDAEVGESRGAVEVDRYRSDNFLDTLIDGAINKGFARGTKAKVDLTELLKTYTYVAHSEVFYNPDKDLTFSPSAIANAHASLAPNKNISKLLLEHPDLRMVDTLSFIPGINERMAMWHGRRIYNTWAPRGLLPSKEDVNISIWEDHLKYLVDDDEEGYIHLASCIAHTLAHPGRRIRHAVVLGSKKEGTGKSYLKQIFRDIIGKEHVMEVSTDQLREQYNEWLGRSEVVFVEELMAGGRLDIVNRLKPMLSEDTITIRKMRTDSFTAPNPASFFCTTNHRDAVILDSDSRRFWVWFSDADPKSASYYKKLFKWSKDNISSIYKWAMEYDLSDFDPEAPPPKTKHFKEMVGATAKPLNTFLMDQIEAEDWPFKKDLVIVSDLLMALRTVPGMGKMSSIKLSNALRDIGSLNLGQKRMLDGSKPRVWAVREAKAWATADEKAINEGYHNPGPYDQKNLDY